jgi:hypothetical protein
MQFFQPRFGLKIWWFLHVEIHINWRHDCNGIENQLLILQFSNVICFCDFVNILYLMYF